MGRFGSRPTPPLAGTANALRQPVRKIKPLPAIVTTIGAHPAQPHEYIAESPVPRPAHIRRITARAHEYAPGVRLSCGSCQDQCISFPISNLKARPVQLKLAFLPAMQTGRFHSSLRACSLSRTRRGTGKRCLFRDRRSQPKACLPLAKPVGN